MRRNTGEQRHLSHQDPYVLGHGQFADAVEVKPADRMRIQELADR